MRVVSKLWLAQLIFAATFDVALANAASKIDGVELAAAVSELRGQDHDVIEVKGGWLRFFGAMGYPVTKNQNARRPNGICFDPKSRTNIAC